jgi:phosphomannomutase
VITESIFKANDIRGLFGGPHAEWDAAGARAIGAAYVAVFGLAGREFVMSRDMRVSGPEVAAAFAEGARAQGASVVDAGLASTDELWYASGLLHLHGVQFTASHNPPDYNGIKFCLPDAAPVSPESLVALRRTAMGPVPAPAPTPGERREIDLLAGYGEYLRSLVNLDGLRPLKVVVDAGNGMAGLTTGAVLGPLGLDIVGLYLELDGRFPNHMPNPLIPENLVAAQQAVRDHGADVGLVFDGDADRCFIIDERGDVVQPSVVTAMIAEQELAREPGGTIVINKITSRSVAERVASLGGRLVVSRVGHTSMKAHMAHEGAIFGGEHSAHYYFREFWGADTGMLAGLHVLSLLGQGTATMSQLADRFGGYAASGEINSTVSDVAAVLASVRAAFADRGVADDDDGVTITGEDWWVNVRASNTEPLVRLNVEARQENTMAALRDEALAIIQGGTHE